MFRLSALVIVVSFLFSSQSLAQAPAPFDADRSFVLPGKANEITLKEIDAQQLASLVKQNAKKLNYIVLFTAGCSGTPYVMKYVNEMQEKYGDDLAVYLIACDHYKGIPYVQNKLFEHHISTQPYIISSSYGKKGDARKKGVKLRNELSAECTPDEIGVPYNLVYNADMQLLFHGYRGFNNDLPADIITYLAEKQ